MIALCGQQHFSPAFKKRFGMIAKDWRQIGGTIGHIPRYRDHSFYLVQQLLQAIRNPAIHL